MTRLINCYTGTIAIGGITSVLALFISPNFVAAPLSFTGGALAGASVIEKRRYEEEEGLTTSGQVSGAFRALYDRNRGIISPVELAIASDIDVDIASDYLTALANDTNGQKIQGASQNDFIFSFPHSSNVLDELTKNAQNWAQAQLETTTQQNVILTQKLDEANQIIRVAQMAQAAAPRQTVQRTNDDLWGQE
jgi:hypothetical protein